MPKIRKTKTNHSNQPPKPPTKRSKNTHDLDPEKISDTLAECKPYQINNIRKIKGYSLTRFAFVKGRWVGKTLKEVYSKEFQMEIDDEVIEHRNLKINGERAKSPDTILKMGYFIESTIHFHEKPVIHHEKIEIVFEDEDVIVVNKPSSMPVHPGGCFRHNSLQYQLARETGKYYKVIHRIDSVTSGCCMLGKSQKGVSEYIKEIREKKVGKVYMARVVGSFPEKEILCKMPLYHSQSRSASVVSNLGKYSETKFTKVFEFKDETGIVTSVVKCEPRTGRTHQIRVHLKGLGFPIVNDPLYNSPKWGVTRFENCGVGDMEENEDPTVKNEMKLWAKSDEEQQVVESIPLNVGRERKDRDDIAQRTSVMNGLCVFKGEKKVETDKNLENTSAENSNKPDEHLDPTCYGCMDPMPDPKPEEMILYLHSLQYKILGNTFTTTMPDWADEKIQFTIPESYVNYHLKDYPK